MGTGEHYITILPADPHHMTLCPPVAIVKDAMKSVYICAPLSIKSVYIHPLQHSRYIVMAVTSDHLAVVWLRGESSYVPLSNVIWFLQSKRRTICGDINVCISSQVPCFSGCLLEPKSELQNCKTSRDLNLPIESKLSREILASSGFKSLYLL